MKTDGAVADARAQQAKLLLLAVLAFMAVVSLWTPLAFAHRGALVLAAEHSLSVAGADASPR